MAQAPKTWIPTGSPENFAATRERGFALIGPGNPDRSPWRLGFQGRLRTVSDADAELLLDRRRAADGAPAPA